MYASRRSFLCGCAGALIWPSNLLGRQETQQFGCFSARAGTCGTYSRNDPDRFKADIDFIDKDPSSLRTVLERLHELLGIDSTWLPHFTFFDDAKEGNACVSEPIQGIRTRRPPILAIGRNLAKIAGEIDAQAHGGALTGLLAHEIAHLFQMQNRYVEQLSPERDKRGTVRLLEIHADYLAGWCLPQTYWTAGSLSALRTNATQFFKLGDINFMNRDHHGTQYQRQSAMAAGFVRGLTHPSDHKGAGQSGLEFIGEVFHDWIKQ